VFSPTKPPRMLPSPPVTERLAETFARMPSFTPTKPPAIASDATLDTTTMPEARDPETVASAWFQPTSPPTNGRKPAATLTEPSAREVVIVPALAPTSPPASTVPPAALLFAATFPVANDCEIVPPA
jgi:hypothetical protein